MNDNQDIESVREFLNRNANLLTVLSIFNALSIYTQSLENSYSEIASLTFAILSIYILGLIIGNPFQFWSSFEVKNLEINLLKSMLIVCQVCLVLSLLYAYDFKTFSKFINAFMPYIFVVGGLTLFKFAIRRSIFLGKVVGIIWMILFSLYIIYLLNT